MSASDIVYLPRWRPAGHAVGAHRGREAGGPGTYRDNVSYLRHPDARRIDVRATVRDPFGDTHVRRFEARTALEVWALVDLSASMRFQGHADRAALVRDLCTRLAASATRIGDAFGMIGCDERVREDAFLPATRRLGTAVEHAARVADRVADLAGTARGAAGLIEGARRLAGRPKLVFVVSDFRWPTDVIAEVFAALALHDAVPIVLADPAENEALPAFGLMELHDSEGGGSRVALMRPSLRRRWLARERERLDALRRVASVYGRPPFHVGDRFDAEALSRHLLTT